ncbi:MAG: sigma 54-interacting transcriptional regulator [Angelakisella sp.]|nr:sigma 54-interacting transcriptional regulator [Angelakisella sp.]
MEHPLLNIQNTVMQYAEIISKVTGVDVEVVDNRLFRVAGTGIYASAVNTDMSGQGHVYRYVLETGKRQVIAEPGIDPLCRECSERFHCKESFEISTPIKMKDNIIGVIGLIGSHCSQKALMMENLDTYLEFIDQIADFIAVKAHENREAAAQMALLDTLNKVINSMSQCVLILGDDRVVSHINQSALLHLKLKDNCVGTHVTIEATGDTVSGQKEFKLDLDGRQYAVFGELYTVAAQTNNYREVLLFRTSKDLQSQIYTMTATVNSMSTSHIIGESAATRKLRDEIRKVAHSSSTVLVTGESGTGKEMVATAIWKAGDRANKRFVAINCAAIPEPLLESELFGYVKGAFTGADPNGRIGKFELADKGVIFLDEIGDMPLYLQAKLLRVLQQRTITRIGSNQLLPIDVRVIAATNKDLKRMIEEKTFREDLYYRLNVIPLQIPPLRERKEDLEQLMQHFIQRYGSMFGKQCRKIDPEVRHRLLDYNWPGNVRELENAVEFMMNMMEEDGVLSISTLPRSILEQPQDSPTAVTLPGPLSITPLALLEQQEISRAIALYGSDLKGKQQAAKSLGIGIATLYRKLEKMGESKLS